jgi:folate-binding protein YgfZ
MTLAEDYEALRRGAGARLVPRDAVVVSGPDAASYLQGQCSQDVAALGVGASADSLLLSPQGKLDALVRVSRRAEDEYLLDVDGGWGAAVRERLERFKLRVKVEIAEVPMGCLSMRGPKVAADVDAPGAQLVVAFSWGGAEGVDVLGDGVGQSTLQGLEPTVRRCGPAAWEAVRVEAGIPVMGADLDDRTIAAEAGLVGRAVSFTKGCFTGQELVARLDARGSKVARRLTGLVLVAGEPTPVPDGAESGEAAPPLPAGTEVVVGDTAVGAVTSSAWSPVRGAVALAYLHRRVTPPTGVQVRLPDGRVVAAEAREIPLAG